MRAGTEAVAEDLQTSHNTEGADPTFDGDALGGKVEEGSQEVNPDDGYVATVAVVTTTAAMPAAAITDTTPAAAANPPRSEDLSE